MVVATSRDVAAHVVAAIATVALTGFAAGYENRRLRELALARVVLGVSDGG